MKQNRLSTEQKQQIVELLATGLSKYQVATQMGIEWKQVDYWDKNKARVAELVYARDLKSRVERHTGSSPVSCTSEQSYAYVLGLYLGDGCIVNTHRDGVQDLRIFQDVKYPDLAAEHIAALSLLYPTNKATILPTSRNISVVHVYSSLHSLYFPQQGAGLKHNRNVALLPWQQDIVTRYPAALLRGLIQPDGCRYNHRVGKQTYVKYNFTNCSADIINIAQNVSLLLGLAPTIHSRPSVSSKGELTGATKHTITYNKREDVKILETIIGPKS